MVDRIDRDQYFMSIAHQVAKRATCRRKQVGCVLVDEQYHIQATGFNGVARQAPHCLDSPCPGADLPSGTGLELCEAIHAEANALLQCSDVESVFAAYCTHSPCIFCARLLANTSCQFLFYATPYAHSQALDFLWEETEILCECLPLL